MTIRMAAILKMV